MNKENWQFSTIGKFHSKAVRPYEAPRQGGLDDIDGFIRLEKGQMFEQALEDLEGFDRLWILYVFHHNDKHWKAKVNTPRTPDGKKKGVFATRAPYRPNPIGISCVKYKGRKGLKLFLEECDLLDGTPILDIKPYIPYADSFPDAQIGWLENIEDTAWNILVPDAIQERFNFLEKHSEYRIKPFLDKHLRYQPKNSRHKRIRKTGVPGEYLLSIQTWRIIFTLDTTKQDVQIQNFFTGYHSTDLEAGSKDPWGDKNLHRFFLEHYPEATLPEGLENHRHK